MPQCERDHQLRHLALLILAAFCALALLAPPTHAYFSSDFEQRYFAHPDLMITDHTLIYNDGLYHLFYTVGISGQGWAYPNNMFDFGHALSTDLIHWYDQPRVLRTIPNTWKERNLWAPHVISLPPGTPQGRFLFYYCGVDSYMVQATGVARTPDFLRWYDLSVYAPAYHPNPAWANWALFQWSNGRDPFAFRLGNSFGLLSTALASAAYTGDIDRGAISLAYSTDGVTFVDAGFPMFVNDSFRVLESLSLYRRPDRYFLFFHESGLTGIRYMTSPSLINGWDKTQTQMLDPVAFAPSEVISTGNGTIMGRCYDADYSGTVIYGAKFDTLSWTLDSVTFRNVNTLLDKWNATGDAFLYQPAYGDRPFARGEAPSGVEGFFWINSAETYTGPIHNNNPNAPPAYEHTGVLRSHPFTITGGHIRFLIGGGNDSDNLYMALVDAESQVVYRRSTGTDSNVMVEKYWDLTGLTGTDCYIEIVDNRDSGDDGYIAVDGIREGVGPPGTSVAEGPAPQWISDLGAAYPSPTRGAAWIPFRVERPGRVRLGIYDVAGRLRRLVLDQDLGTGSHSMRWDGRDVNGDQVPAGVYYLRFESPNGSASRPLAVVR